MKIKFAHRSKSGTKEIKVYLGVERPSTGPKLTSDPFFIKQEQVLIFSQVSSDAEKAMKFTTTMKVKELNNAMLFENGNTCGTGNQRLGSEQLSPTDAQKSLTSRLRYFDGRRQQS